MKKYEKKQLKETNWKPKKKPRESAFNKGKEEEGFKKGDINCDKCHRNIQLDEDIGSYSMMAIGDFSESNSSGLVEQKQDCRECGVHGLGESSQQIQISVSSQGEGRRDRTGCQKRMRSQEIKIDELCNFY